jgi:hypothetical protein
MKTEGKIWVIFDAVKSKKTKPLSVVQAQMMILSFKSRELSHYHIWTPGWPEWISLSAFLETDQKYFAPAQPPEPVVSKKEPSRMLKSVATSLKTERYAHLIPKAEPEAVDYGYYYNEFNGEDLSLSGLPDKASMDVLLNRKALGSAKDRRLNTRHDFKIEARLMTRKGSVFRTHSKNISLTGILLEDELPKDS